MEKSPSESLPYVEGFLEISPLSNIFFCFTKHFRTLQFLGTPSNGLLSIEDALMLIYLWKHFQGPLKNVIRMSIYRKPSDCRPGPGKWKYSCSL